jgi:energy-coupling factor transporter ATP-binding protein EcfA2
LSPYTQRVRITSLSGAGVLSFDHFTLGLSKRVTFVVGPNGAGKSNTARLLTICQRALDLADGATGGIDRQLAMFLGARHMGSESQGIEVRVAIKLTNDWERSLITEFFRAMIATTLIIAINPSPGTDRGGAWADAEVTEEKLRALFEGEIVVSHPGTEDGRWECAYEFSAIGHDQAVHKYRWVLLGFQSRTLIDANPETTVKGIQLAGRLRDTVPKDASGPDASTSSSFRLLDLLPPPAQSTVQLEVALSPQPPASQRRFAQMAGLSLVSPDSRAASLATVLRLIFRRALVHTSDLRLLPFGGAGWSSSESALVEGGEARLPELLIHLKNGSPPERARYRRIQELFAEFTQGRRCETRLMPVPQTADDSQQRPLAQVPSIAVTVNASDVPDPLAPEVPIEFAGAGAWEALVLASVLAEDAASVVVLDEPAVALHPSQQRQLGAHLLTTSAQFLVITHSAELLPLDPAADVQFVRIDRDDKSATRSWPMDEACLAKITAKLKATGNERLPFASRAILCEGQDDVAAIMTLSERMKIDLRRQNITVVNCSGRNSLPSYIWFSAQLGLKYLAIADGDASKPDAQADAQAVRDAVAGHSGGELFEFPENLESTFGVAKQRDSLVPSAIRNIPFIGNDPDPSSAPSEVVTLADAIRRLIR